MDAANGLGLDVWPLVEGEMSALAASGESGERLHALDAVRAGALLLGVFFHATMSFLEPRIWIVGDSETSPALNVTFFVLHIFRMTLFFLIAGFFGRMLLERRGVGGFVRDRLKRIGIPLLAFWPIVITAIIAVAIWAAVQANGGVAPEGPPPPALTLATFPLTHLWFLYVLLIFYAGALLLRGVFRLIDRHGKLRAALDAPVRWIAKTPLSLLILPAPAFIALALKPDWMMWFGIPTPDTGFIPNPVALCAYGTAFAFGWALQRQPDTMRAWEKTWLTDLALAITLTVVCVWLAGTQLDFTIATMGWKKLLFAACYLWAAWVWTFTLIGMALRFLSNHSPIRRYVADASYWIYIVHLPVVMVMQTLLALSPMPAIFKFEIVVATTLAFGLATYHVLVRYSWLGAILNGRKQQRRIKQPKAAAVAAE